MADEDQTEIPQTPSGLVANSEELNLLPSLLSLAKQSITKDARPSMLNGQLAKSTDSIARGKKGAARFADSTAGTNTPTGDELMSEGAVAAADVLRFLAVNTDTPKPRMMDVVAPPSAKANATGRKRRKLSVSETHAESEYQENIPKPPTAKRARPVAQTNWSASDRKQFMELYEVHGKNYQAIADAIDSKTPAQCRNYYQNNAKKLGLQDKPAIRTKAAKEPKSQQNGDPLSVIKVAPPAAGYFDVLPSNAVDAEIKPSNIARGGGMNLRNLLDDAPDAVGGASDSLNNAQPANPPIPDEDSSTEDELDTHKKYAVHKPIPRRASDLTTIAEKQQVPYQGFNIYNRSPTQMFPVDPALQRSLAHKRQASFSYTQPRSAVAASCRISPSTHADVMMQATPHHQHSRSFSDSRGAQAGFGGHISPPFPSVLGDRPPAVFMEPKSAAYGSFGRTALTSHSASRSIGQAGPLSASPRYWIDQNSRHHPPTIANQPNGHGRSHRMEDIFARSTPLGGSSDLTAFRQTSLSRSQPSEHTFRRGAGSPVYDSLIYDGIGFPIHPRSDSLSAARASLEAAQTTPYTAPRSASPAQSLHHRLPSIATPPPPPQS